MGRKLTNKGGEGQEYPKVPEGNHRACIVAVTELGTHTERAFVQGEPDKQRFKYQLVYELLDEEREDPRAGPWVIGHVYTETNYKDAPIMKVMAAALMRPMGEDEEPDVETLVGKVVMVNVVHKAGKADPSKTYDGVAGVMPLASALKKLPARPVNPPAYFGLGKYVEHDWHPRIFGVKVADKIKESLEARGGAFNNPADVNATTREQVDEVIGEAVATNAPQTPMPSRPGQGKGVSF